MLGANWTLHDLRHSAAKRMVRDPHLTLAAAPAGPGQPVRRRVPQVMKRPVRSQNLVGPAEHCPGRRIGQHPERPPQRPPHRMARTSRHQAVHLLLVKTQPHECVRRAGSCWTARDPLRITVTSCWPGSIPPASTPSSSDARAPVEIQNASSARSRCEHQRREQLIELAIRDLPRDRRATRGRNSPARCPPNPSPGRTGGLPADPPSEPCVPLIAAHGSSKPLGRQVRCAGSLRWRAFSPR